MELAVPAARPTVLVSRSPCGAPRTSAAAAPPPLTSRPPSPSDAGFSHHVRGLARGSVVSPVRQSVLLGTEAPGFSKHRETARSDVSVHVDSGDAGLAPRVGFSEFPQMLTWARCSPCSRHLLHPPRDECSRTLGLSPSWRTLWPSPAASARLFPLSLRSSPQDNYPWFNHHVLGLRHVLCRGVACGRSSCTRFRPTAITCRSAENRLTRLTCKSPLVGLLCFFCVICSVL